MPDYKLSDFAFKLEAAVDTLATSPRSLQDRLYYAAMTWAGIHHRELPEGQHRDAFVSIWNELNVTAASGDEGTLRATCSTLSDDKAEQISQRICDLARAVRADAGN